ncbi:nitroreductase family protein [Candidatus Harpocratesius sp.]
MNLDEIIKTRRAFRSLKPVKITEKIIDQLAYAAQLMPSCFNNQPWRFVFVKDNPFLENLKNEALSQGNAWAKHASMIIAIFSEKNLDCIIRDRIYYQFDVGMAAAAMILKATDLNLVAHPIAGFSPNKVKKIVNIPETYDIISLIIVGKRKLSLNDVLSKGQIESEKIRPKRIPLEKFRFINVVPDKIVKK